VGFAGDQGLDGHQESAKRFREPVTAVRGPIQLDHPDNNPKRKRHKPLLALIISTCVFVLAPRETLTQEKRIPEAKPQTQCSEKSDRRYAVCRGAWSTKTTALFNTWIAPDLNPGRRLDFSSPYGHKVIHVRDVHVRIEIDGRSYWTPFGNMHDAEVGWAPDSKRLFVT